MVDGEWSMKEDEEESLAEALGWSDLPWWVLPAAFWWHALP